VVFVDSQIFPLLRVNHRVSPPNLSPTGVRHQASTIG